MGRNRRKKNNKRQAKRPLHTSSVFSRSSAIWRVLDANVNRAREGLRIIEDTARFVIEDAAAAEALRGLRHGLDELVRGHYRYLLAARNVARDPGRSNPAKPYRGGVRALLAANFKRCEEAFRVFEEYGRVISPRAIRRAQMLRFKIYQWEARLLSNGFNKRACM